MENFTIFQNNSDMSALMKMSFGLQMKPVTVALLALASYFLLMAFILALIVTCKKIWPNEV